MTAPLQTRKHLSAEDLEMDGDYGVDFGFDDIAAELETGEMPDDFFVAAQEEAAGRGPATLQDVEAYVDFLKELLAASPLDTLTRNALQRDMDRLERKAGFSGFLSGAARQEALLRIHEALYQLEAQIPAPGASAAAPEAGALEALDAARAELDSMKNLSKDESNAMAAQIEKWKKELELHPESAEKILASLEALRSDAVEKNVYSPTLKGLARALQMDPEDIQAKAQAEGLDLTALNNPPPKEFFEFLAECSPEFKSLLQSVVSSVDERILKYEKLKQAAIGQSAHNKNGDDSNEDDIKDMAHWQDLFDIKYHQDERSEAVIASMRQAVEFLIPILSEIFPNETVQVMEASGSGWEKRHQAYLNADKIQIGSLTLDLFDSRDGSLRASMSPDDEPELEIPKLEYDAEGDGAWDPFGDAEGVQAYSERMTDYLQTYDETKDGAAIDDA